MIEAELARASSASNDARLWASVRRVAADFLRKEWQGGALRGRCEKEAFFVRCDLTTLTQDDIDNGRLVIEVGVAVVKPAEFVIIRIGVWVKKDSCDTPP